MAGDTSPSPDIEAALAAAHKRGDQAGFLRILAVSRVVLPQLQQLDQEGGLRLPLVEQEGTRYVLAFSSQQRLAESRVDAEETVVASGSQLAGLWPEDEELCLLINPGSDLSVAVPADAIRALPSMAGDKQ